MVLKGYSKIACGRGIKALEQKQQLERYVFSDSPNIVSNIDLLCKGLVDYSSLYNKVTYDTLRDDEDVHVDSLKLCPKILDYSMPYYAGVHIVVKDIKSTNISGKVTCATSKNLLRWAWTKAKDFWRANTFCSKTNQPMISGDT